MENNENNTISESGEKKDSTFISLPASILIAAVLISGSIIYLVWSQGRQALKNPNGGAAAVGDTGNQAPQDTSFLKLGARDAILGEASAPVTIIEYGDYQCPFCARYFSQVEPSVRADYVKSGKVKIVYRGLAFLDQRSPDKESHAAAEAAECAKDQGKFWPFHDAIFSAEEKDGQENNGNLNEVLFLKIAGDLKLNVPDFKTCYESGKYSAFVDQVTQNAAAAGINSTPTTFVDTQEVKGLIPYSQLKAAIDSFLK